MAAPLARRPTATAVAAEAAGARLPAYVTREQARAVIAAAQSTRDRLLFECLWQTGGRVTEVLRLRRGGVDAREGALRSGRVGVRGGARCGLGCVTSGPPRSQRERPHPAWERNADAN